MTIIWSNLFRNSCITDNIFFFFLVIVCDEETSFTFRTKRTTWRSIYAIAPLTRGADYFMTSHLINLTITDTFYGRPIALTRLKLNRRFQSINVIEISQL